MKKFLALLLAGLMLVALTACGSKTCKESGCDQETYKKGYCVLHYAENYPDEALKDALGQLEDMDLDDLQDQLSGLFG